MANLNRLLAMFKRPTSSSGSSKNSLSVYSGHAAHTSNFVIPLGLSFENVMDPGHKTCPPCTEKDFRQFCRYVDYSEENILFFLWFQGYATRFNARVVTNPSDLALAPEWTSAMQEEATAMAISNTKRNLGVHQAEMATGTSALFAGTDFAQSPGHQRNATGLTIGLPPTNPFDTPPRTASKSGRSTISAAGTPSAERGNINPWDTLDRASMNTSQATGNSKATFKELAQDAFQGAGVLAPFTIQPFREEVNRIVATYLRIGSPRQLNLSDKERTVALRALQYTTHPSAFAPILATVEASLRQTHKRFIRHVLCNGNPARIVFARALGAALIVLGFLLAIILTISKAPRGFRALCAIPLVIGMSTLLAGLKGMCVVLHGLHHRHLRPWELFEDDAEDRPSSSFPPSSLELNKIGVATSTTSTTSVSKSISFELEEKGSKKRSDSSIDFFAPPVSLEDEPWVKKYESRNVVRKIFDRQRWCQEPAIRQMQDRVFFESLAWAGLFAACVVVLFVPLPGGRVF